MPTLEFPFHPAAAFGPGTMILTPDGEQPVEWLEAGVRVVTRDHGVQTLATLLRFTPGADWFARHPGTRVVEVLAGGLDGLLPNDALTVTAQQRILLREPAAELYFGTPEVLVPAAAWIGGDLIHPVAPAEPVTLTALVFDRPELVHASGVWVEASCADTRAPAPRPCLTLREAALVVRPSRLAFGLRVSTA